jgi:hypothetical protein
VKAIDKEALMVVSVASDLGVFPLPAAVAAGDALWLSPSDAELATGWTMKPEGLCRDQICVPVPRSSSSDFVRDGAINIAAFWRHMDAPVRASEAGDVWVFGERADVRATALDHLEAPDFELPDVSGRKHRLSDYRGQKVLLATWASW